MMDRHKEYLNDSQLILTQFVVQVYTFKREMHLILDLKEKIVHSRVLSMTIIIDGCYTEATIHNTHKEKN